MGQLGYDHTFLGTAVAPPSPGPDTADEPADRPVDELAALDYTHFTVQMHPTRRLAW